MLSRVAGWYLRFALVFCGEGGWLLFHPALDLKQSTEKIREARNAGSLERRDCKTFD
jgi:hypothetical protein